MRGLQDRKLKLALNAGHLVLCWGAAATAEAAAEASLERTGHLVSPHSSPSCSAQDALGPGSRLLFGVTWTLKAALLWASLTLQ